MNIHHCQHFDETRTFVFRHPCDCGEDKGQYGHDCRADDRDCAQKPVS